MCGIFFELWTFDLLIVFVLNTFLFEVWCMPAALLFSFYLLWHRQMNTASDQVLALKGLLFFINQCCSIIVYWTKTESLHLMFFCQHVKNTYKPLTCIVLLESLFIFLYYWWFKFEFLRICRWIWCFKRWRGRFLKSQIKCKRCNAFRNSNVKTKVDQITKKSLIFVHSGT